MKSVVDKTNPRFSVTTDVSGSWGCGAFSGTQWFSLKWNINTASLYITVQELLPITMTAALWDHNGEANQCSYGVIMRQW